MVFYFKLQTIYIFLADPFQDLISELGKTEENSSHILISDDYEQTSNLSTTKITTTTTTPEPTTTIPKSCPAPDVTYNGSLLSTVQATFKVESILYWIFEVKFRCLSKKFWIQNGLALHSTRPCVLGQILDSWGSHRI